MAEQRVDGFANPFLYAGAHVEDVAAEVDQFFMKLNGHGKTPEEIVESIGESSRNESICQVTASGRSDEI
ncbi:MAG: hypothetical protein EA377_12500 [Phycisphaerales bacterium]|nr:MAG: hypothetical protein EA377_12500 [Phycisphaerales bacterium]